MSDEIRADYDELEQVASRFATQSQAVQQMMQKVNQSANKLISGDWKGRGIEAFTNEMTDEVFPATKRLYEALEEASRATNDIAQTLKTAEEEACSPFRVS